MDARSGQASPLADRRGRLDRWLPMRFSAEVAAELSELAEASGLSRSALIRHLVELGRQAMARQHTRDAELLTLATLLASEQTLELLQQIVPDGRHRSAAAREAAIAAADARLAELREQLARESSQ